MTPGQTPLATMHSVKSRIASTARWLAALQAGIDGHPKSLGSGEADAMERCLARIGIVLLTKTKAAKLNLEMRRGAKPVAIRYYGAPISGRHPLYCAQQFRQKTGKEKAGAADN